ncbi:MAG TPA: rod shape-determining protein MreD [Bacillota bacterium]|nr:rod shape-determining protein MreD [Bacillota bacterium]
MSWLPTVAVLLLSVICQATVVPYLAVLHAPPDFVLTAVMLTGLIAGSASGGAYGVAAGLCLDLWRGRQIGLMAIGIGLAGALAGLVGERVYPGRAGVRFLTVSLGTVLAQGIILGLYRATHGLVAWSAVERTVGLQALYNGVLAVICYPLVIRLRRGVAPTP